MKNFDEYQRFKRYRNGHHTFFFTIFLLVVNIFIELITGTGWGEPRSVEVLVILSISVIFFNITNTFQGAYFRKTEKPLWSNLGILVAALFYLMIYFAAPSFGGQGLIEEGNITIRAVHLLVFLNAISIPITYFISLLIERRKD